MSQHDYVLANATGATFRADLNNALAAIVSQNSGATEPATMSAYQFWADTTTGILKQRNAANSAWISLITISTGVMLANAALAGSGSQAFSASDFIGAIGSTTPNTGAFTTLSASSGFTAQTGTDHKLWLQTPSGYATTGVTLGSYNSAGSAYLPLWINALSFGVATEATERMVVTSAGLAVTGAISATTTIKTGGYTVATLPAGATGDRAYVTDATAPTYLGALTGGGTVVCPVFKNATVWVSA